MKAKSVSVVGSEQSEPLNNINSVSLTVSGILLAVLNCRWSAALAVT